MIARLAAWRNLPKRRLATDEGGAVAIEFAIVAMAFILVSIGIIEFGRALHVRNELGYAADFGVRQILMDPDLSDTAIEAAITAEFDGFKAGSLNVTLGTVDRDGSPISAGDAAAEDDITDFRTIELNYPIALLIPGFTNTMTLRASRRVPLI